MAKRLNIHKRKERIILEATLPFVVLPLVRKKLITEEHLDDPQKLSRLILHNARIWKKDIQWVVGIDQSFLKESVKYWRRGEKLLSIVLYATAIEQYINQWYQAVLPRQGWTKHAVTALIRKPLRIDEKLGWMFEGFTKCRFPRPLCRRLESVFAIRNSIIHYKGEPGHPDPNEDSHSKLEADIEKKLRRMSPSRDFRLMEEALTDVLFKIDPDRELVCRVMETLRLTK